MIKRYRILNAEPDSYSHQARGILQTFADVDERYLDRTQLLDCIDEYDVLIVRLGFQIDKEVIGRGKRLISIVTATTGVDHIDLGAAENSGIEVLCLHGEVDFLRSIPATAELTWGLILALVRNLPAANWSAIQGNWDRESYRGYDLSGKTLGILGLGRIGEKVANYGIAFGMRVIAYDNDTDKKMSGVTMMNNMKGLLNQSQIVSIHLPLNESTTGIINGEALKMLPKNAWLINTARGDLVDEEALVSALKSQKLAGAALDVVKHEREINLAESEIIRYARNHSNVIITPHIGGATFDSMASTEIFMANKLKRFLESREG